VRWPIRRPIFGFWGKKVPQNVRFPAQQTTMQNVTPLALFSVVKSSTVQTHTQNYKQTSSNRYIHTFPIGMCG